MTGRELAQRFGISHRTINKYVEKGLLPPPRGYGRWATYDPICAQLLRQLVYLRENLSASIEDLAERRQITGQLLPPDGPEPPVIARGPV